MAPFAAVIAVVVVGAFIDGGAKIEALEVNGRLTDHEFNDQQRFSHPDTGEVLHLNSQGKFKNVINLNSVKGLKRITCIMNKLSLAFEDSDTARSWRPGDVIMGDETWECQLGLSHAPEKGIFRKIESMKILDEKRVDLISTEASLFDMFEHAHIFYHHTPARGKRADEDAEAHVRTKRASWFDELVNAGKSKILSKVFPISWGGSKGLVRDINYNNETGEAAGKFGVGMTATKDIGFDAKENKWFEHEKNKETDTSKFHTSSSVVSRFECVACYASFHAGVTFELKIRRDSRNRIIFEKYLLQFEAEAKVNYDVRLTVEGKYSIDVAKRLWRSARPWPFNIRIGPGISLKFTIGAELWLQASFEANAELSVTTGFHSSAKFTVSNQKLGSNPSTFDVSRMLEPFVAHPPRLDLNADATGTFSVYPKGPVSMTVTSNWLAGDDCMRETVVAAGGGGKATTVIEIAAGIAWGVSESIFEISLAAPVAIGLKPELTMTFNLQSSMGSAMVGEFDMLLNVDMNYEVRPVRFNLHIIGKPWRWDIVRLSKTGELALLNRPLELAVANIVTCPATSTKLCDKPGTPITSRSSKRLTKVTTSGIVFESSNSRLMASAMAKKLLRFSEMIKYVDGWQNRKLVVKQAWSPTVQGLGSEGREIKVGITKPSSDSEDTSSSTATKLGKLARCAQFCGVRKESSATVIGVKRARTLSDTNYITVMKTPKQNKLRIYELPVGQGDGTVIQCSDGTVTLVDLGSSTSTSRGYWGFNHISSFMTRRNINEIKHVFITHGDQDHFNLIPGLINSVNRGKMKIYYSDVFNTLANTFPRISTKLIRRCTGTRSCESFPLCPGVEMQVVASQLGSLPNEKGIVLRLKHGGFTMLFVGDVSEKASSDTLKRYPSDIKADVYKLGHHGSKRAKTNTISFLNTVQPKIVISSGDPWYTYKHPNCISLETALDSGNILRSSASGFRIRTQTDFTCGDSSGRANIDGFGKALYTHAPTETTLNLIIITYDAVTKITKVKPLQMSTDSHSSASSRGRRSTDSEIADDSSFGGSDFPDISWCSNEQHPNLQPGESRPPSRTMNEVCKPIIQPIGRSDERVYTLYYYRFDDVVFGNGNNSCDSVEDDDIANMCASRVMAFRLAFRLKRLAFFVAQQWNDRPELHHIPTPDCHDDLALCTLHVKVKEAWREKTGLEKIRDESLHYEGRALRIGLVGRLVTNTDVSLLSHLAQCAGFDYVTINNHKELELCGLLQENVIGEFVSFYKTRLYAIAVPPYLEEEYGYPEALVNETRKTRLFDGIDVTEKVSDHITIGDIALPGKRFFRIDHLLVECLEEVKGEMSDAKIINPVYRTLLFNNRDIDTRHSEEKHRFHAGQAAELKLAVGSKFTLFDLAKVVVRSCLKTFNFEQLVLGLGAHQHHLYLDLRPQEIGESRRLVVWEAETTKWFNELQPFARAINHGGPLIDPVSLAHACREPTHGEKFPFISERSSSERSCLNEDAGFCQETKKIRQQAVKDFMKKLKRLVRVSSQVRSSIETCFVTSCGCGVGFGSAWEKKIRSCMEFISDYIESSTVPFAKQDKAAFFNTANVNSSVHSLACDNGLCLENNQLYSLLKQLLITTYKPVDGESIEEMVFSSRDNPNPSISLLEQFMAMNAKGHVNVYIEKRGDISALRKPIKALLVFNKQVSKVTIHVSSDVHTGKVEDELARKTQFWASGECPKRTRVAVAPFNVVEIPHHRIRRSIELSHVRNLRMTDIHNWEMAWLSRN